MTLTPEQVSQFHEQGYTAAPALFTPDEARAMKAELLRLQNEGKFRNVSTEGDGKTHSSTRQNLQICPLNPHSDLFRALPFCEKITRAVAQLIGDPLVLHLDQVFLKPARHGSGTNWHQDNAYFGLTDPTKGTAMWIAVDPATVDNGTIHVIPGYASRKLEHQRDPESDHHIRCYPPEELAVPIELPAGGAAFFAYGTPHCTRANNTDRDRAGVAFHFLNGQHLDDEGLDTRTLLGTCLTGDDATGGEREYGERIAGTWPQHVEQTLTREPAL